MVNEPLYDEDLVNLGYLNTRLEGTSALLLSQSQNFGTLPTTPYYKYNTYMGTDGIYICINERLIGDYNANDWTKASTYVNVEDAFTQGIVTAGLLQAVNGGSYAAGITGEGTGDTSVRIWAGSTFADRADAPFRVTQGGAVTATNIAITGGSLTWNNLNKPTKSDLGTWTTYIDNNGIYTGTLTANQVNAVAINADSITSGTINTSRLNTDVITTSNFSAQSIDAGNITSGTLSADRLSSNVITTGNLSTQSINANQITTGTMNAARISGGTIAGTNATFGNKYSGGTLRFYNGVGYLSCGVVSDHPWVSALNVASTGGGSQGISFRTTSSIDNVGSERGHISMNTSNAMFITSSGTVNINNGTGGAVGIRNISINGSTITGENGGFMYANSNCMFTPASGKHAYINTTDTGNRIAVSSGGPSSRNVKKNIKHLKLDEYQNIYKDIQQLQTHTFQYKYENIKDKKDDFGFIIDEIEALPTISKYARNYDTKAYVRNNKFIPRRENDKKQEKFKTIEYKEWDRDAYIKTMLLMIKSMQIKIDELEERIKKLEEGGR